MKVIITGATGFLGRNLAESLSNDGIEVLATGRSPVAGKELQEKGTSFVTADIRDLDRLEQAFAPADCVIHCAALCDPWGKYKKFYEANVIGTRNVVKACRKHGIKKMVFISTPSIYFNGKDRYDISENEPLPDRQISNYSKTKRIAEEELTASGDQGYRTIILRPRAVYGPHDATIIPRILRMAEKKHMPLINGGRALIDITYVDNLVDAVKKSLTAPEDAWNDVYNISNGDPINVRDWFSQVLSIFERPFKPKEIPEFAAKTMAAVMELTGYLPFIGKEPPMTRFAVGYMAKSMTMNIDKAKQLLGYSPRVGNQQGFEKYAHWCRGG